MADTGRRRFLGGAGLLATAAAACRGQRDPYASGKRALPPEWNHRLGDEALVVSTCGLCGAGCGIRVRVVDGHAVEIEGNPGSPINRGRLCARGKAGLELLYHPDRVRSPMQRAGARGEDSWQPLSWEEAIGRLVSELGRLRQSGAPQSLVLLDGEERGATHGLWSRFMRAFGSPNHVGHGATGVGATLRAVAAMTGAASLPGYDFEQARLALMVGSGAFEASPQQMHLARAVARGSRPRLVCAWPRLPPSAALVDEWLPLAPAGQVHLLLALAHVLLREELGDETAVEGMDGHKEGRRWRERVRADFSPGKVEARTGVPAARIERLARDLVAARPSLVVVDDMAADDAVTSAGLLLNLLIGGVGEPGGMQLDDAREVPAWGNFEVDEVAEQGLAAGFLDGRPSSREGFEHSRILALPHAILSGKPYAASAVLLHRSNPAFSKPAFALWRQALAKVPFVVSFSPLLDESARFSDLVLPDRTFLERWDVLRPGRGTRVLSLQEPVVRPVRNTMQTAEVLLRVARGLGGSVAGAFPWQSYPEAVKQGLASAAQIVFAPGAPGAFQLPAPATSTSRHQMDWRSFLDALPPSAEASGEGGPGESSFPFVLLPFRGPGYVEGGMRHLPWLAELPMGARDPWQQRIELSPQDALTLGISDGDGVEVESKLATMRMHAHVHAGIRPGVLALPLGRGDWPVADAETNPLGLLGARADARTGQWLAFATRARIRRAG